MRQLAERFRKWQNLVQIAFFVVSGGLAVRVMYGNWNAIAHYDWRLDWISLTVSCLLLSTAFACGVSGWHLLMGSLVGSKSFWDTAEAWFASQLAKYLPLGTIWQILSRALLQQQYGIAKSKTMVVALLEMGIYTITALMVYAISFSVSGNSRWLWLLPFILLVFAIGLFILMPPVFGRLLRWVSGGLHLEDIVVTYSFGDLGIWLLSYSLLWIVAGSGFFFLVRSVIQIPVGDYVALVGIFALSAAAGYLVIFVPRGLLIREAAITLLLSSYIPPSIALAISILARLWYTTVELTTVGLVVLSLHLLCSRRRPVAQDTE